MGLSFCSPSTMDKLVVFFLLISSSYVFAQNGGNPCVGDQALTASGECVDALVSRNIYVFAPPPPEEDEVNGSNEGETSVPKPKLEYNIIFVRAPTAGEGSEPIVVPPPQQKTIVYVLSEKGEAGEPPIIQVPAAPKSKPEVYYVNYVEGENPVLPGGVDLQTALETAAEPAPSVPVTTTKAPATFITQAPASLTSAATAQGAPLVPVAPAAPQVPGAPQLPQAPQYFFVTPQPGVFISQPGGLQQLGFPGLPNLQQQFNPALQG